MSLSSSSFSLSLTYKHILLFSHWDTLLQQEHCRRSREKWICLTLSLSLSIHTHTHFQRHTDRLTDTLRQTPRPVGPALLKHQSLVLSDSAKNSPRNRYKVCFTVLQEKHSFRSTEKCLTIFSLSLSLSLSLSFSLSLSLTHTHTLLETYRQTDRHTETESPARWAGSVKTLQSSFADYCFCRTYKSGKVFISTFNVLSDHYLLTVIMF